MKFRLVGREHEIELLERTWEGQGGHLLLLCGRRRVGKTALLAHWMKSSGHRALYWAAQPSSTAVLLRSFSQTVYAFAFPRVPIPPMFTFATWEQAWEQVARLTQPGRMAVFIDEFPTLLDSTPELLERMVRIWDRLLKNTNLVLGLSGVHPGRIKPAALLERAGTVIDLGPLHFPHLAEYFPEMPVEERTAVYSLFGGVPGYWERFDPDRSLAHNIRAQFLGHHNRLQLESVLLLDDYVDAPHNYAAILSAIAHGAGTPREIAAVTGLPNMHLPRYLGVLCEAGFVERRVPLTETHQSRSGRHLLRDPFLRFYFRFVAPRAGQLALGIHEGALASITRELPDFIAASTWTELCCERLAAGEGLPFVPDRVGGIWNSKARVDAAAIHRGAHALVFATCDWGSTPAGEGAINDLAAKAALLVPREGRWEIYLAGFARSGWNAGAQTCAAELQEHLPGGENWKLAGLHLAGVE